MCIKISTNQYYIYKCSQVSGENKMWFLQLEYSEN